MVTDNLVVRQEENCKIFRHSDSQLLMEQPLRAFEIADFNIKNKG